MEGRKEENEHLLGNSHRLEIFAGFTLFNVPKYLYDMDIIAPIL